VFHTPEKDFKVFHLSAHLSGHYNSIRRGDDNMELYQMPFKTFPIGYDLDKAKKIVKQNEMKKYQVITQDENHYSLSNDAPYEVIKYACEHSGGH
jgi:hypothetical protein